MQRTVVFKIISCSLLCFAFAACSKTETPATTTTNAPAASNSAAASPVAAAASPAASDARVSSTDVVEASAAPVSLTAGGAVDVSVRVRVKEGYHINANPPTFAYLKATELSVEAGEGLTAGKPVYPSSVTRAFAFAEKPLAVYEGETEIKLPLKSSATAAKGARALPLKLRVQACDEKACYPPGTLDVPVALTIK
jgi:hypothetical protein